MPEQPHAVKAWHAVVDPGDPALLDGLLADDDRLVSVTVMVRPVRGLTKLAELMQRQLMGSQA